MFITNLNNRRASASDECDIPPWVRAVASAKERVIPPPCAWLHRVQDLIEMSADCPLELWSWLVKLSQSCDKIITNRELARRLEGGRKYLHYQQNTELLRYTWSQLFHTCPVNGCGIVTSLPLMAFTYSESCMLSILLWPTSIWNKSSYFRIKLKRIKWGRECSRSGSWKDS